MSSVAPARPHRHQRSSVAWVWGALALAVIVVAPQLRNAGFASDDHLALVKLEGISHAEKPKVGIPGECANRNRRYGDPA